MPKQKVTEDDVHVVEALLHDRDDLRHVRVRRRSDLLTLESGPADDPQPNARFRRVAVHLWTLELPTHTRRWEKTPYRDQLRILFAMLVDEFGWLLESWDSIADDNRDSIK